MFILPIGHENQTVRRLPWVTFGILALCFVVFLASQWAGLRSDREERIDELASEIFSYYSERPYLELDSEFMALVFSTTPENLEETSEELRDLLGDVPRPGRVSERRQQERLDEMTAELLSLVRQQPIFRWGMIPADLRLVTLFTSMFLHAGWLHLLGNFLFLYLTGPFIEDVWGRPVFAAFYLLAGALSAALYAGQYPHLQVPLIGASGAIAGVMGAFMIRYHKTRIKFFYLIFFIFRGTFHAPALIMLALWAVGELARAYLKDFVAPESGGGGVAHWAHVWGFAFGALGALVVGAFKVEEKHRERIAADDIENTVVEEAHQAVQEGRPHDAWTLLTTELRRRPSNRDAALALWDLARSQGRTAEAVGAFAREIRGELAEGEDELALFHWRELSELEPDFTPDLGLSLKLAETLRREGEGREAARLVRAAANDLDAATGPGAALRLARLGAALDPALGAEVGRQVLERCELPAEARSELRTLAAGPGPRAPETDAEPSAGPGSGEALPGAAPTDGEPAAAPGLRVLEGVPRALAEGSLSLVMDGGKPARLRLAQVRALAVAAVREPEARRPYLVLDLFLDSPEGAASGEELRVVRCLSRSFDPRKLLPEAASAADVKTAFRLLVENLLAQSGATALLGSDRFGREPLRVFPSLESYQQALAT